MDKKIFFTPLIILHQHFLLLHMYKEFLACIYVCCYALIVYHFYKTNKWPEAITNSRQCSAATYLVNMYTHVRIYIYLQDITFSTTLRQ